MDLREWLQTLCAEYGELTAGLPVVGVGYQWQIASSVAAAHLFAAGRDLALGRPAATMEARLRQAEAALRHMRGLVARRDALRHGDRPADYPL